MTKRQQLLCSVGGGLVLMAALALWAVQRRAQTTSEAADWGGATPTPPEGVIAPPAHSWASGACPSIASACLGKSVGYRIRTYGPTLTAEGESLIREL